MSSTYSSDLRIQLMGTGDQAGTWGATTNNNFQYIFEQAIAGLQTVSVTATPQALTYLNGATSTLTNNQAICAVLVFTNGGVNANFTITTPSGSQKTYVIYNNTSYVATMQVTGSSGSTVAIPSQVTTTVYTDGTNFYAGSTGTIGNFGVNGALAVTGNETVGGTLAVTGATTLTGAAALNGGGTSTTPSSSDNSTKIATTAFVTTAVSTATGSLGTMSTQNANSIAVTGGSMNGVSGTNSGLTVGNATNATNATNAATASNVSGGYVSSVNGGQGAVNLSSTYTPFLTTSSGVGQVVNLLNVSTLPGSSGQTWFYHYISGPGNATMNDIPSYTGIAAGGSSITDNGYVSGFAIRLT